MFSETFGSWGLFLFVTIWLITVTYLNIYLCKSLIKSFFWYLMVNATHELHLTAALWPSKLLLFMLQLMHTKGDGPEQSSRGENPCVGISLC